MKTISTQSTHASILALTLALGVGSAYAQEEDPHFSYNGDTGPANWVDLPDDDRWEACGGGHNSIQSPIDIGKAKVDHSLSLFLTIQDTTVSLSNNGHNIQQDYSLVRDSSSANFGGTIYYLEQFHFHTLSEHAVGGERADLEMHGVFSNSDGETLVVSQLFDVGKKRNALLAKLIKSEDGLPALTTDCPSVDEYTYINFADGLVNPSSFYSYTGSLTTPACTEGVSWVVLKNRASMSEKQWQAFRQIVGNNFRPLQKLNGRKIYQTPGRGNGHRNGHGK